jgi:PAS domain S-box-containing protein
MEQDTGSPPATGDGRGRQDDAETTARGPRLAVTVPLLYAGVSAAWILLSDALVAVLAPSVKAQAVWSVAKGFGFVAVTTVALHAGLRWALRRDRRAREEIHRKEEALGRYRLLAEHGRDVILFVRPEDGRILDANAAGTSTYGYTRAELRALTVFDLRAAGPRAVAAAQLAQADARGIRFETIHRRRDGSPFPVEVSSHGAAIDGVRVVVSVVRDVTERKRAGEALRESDEWLALAAEAARLGTWHAVPWGPLELSPRSREILGLDEAVEIPDFEAYLRLLHPDDRQAVRRSADRWLGPDGDGRYQDEYRCLRPDGTVRWVSAHAKAEFVEVEGVRRPARLAGTLMDVTERKQVEARLMQSDRLASVGMLAAGVAHEINNPLSYLAAALEFVEEQVAGGAAPPADRAELLQALADAREGAGRVRHVVRDLSLFSRMREERRVRVDVRPIVETSINMAGSELRCRARVERDFGVVPEVLANEARLGQVVLNLLINAAQAIPEGRPEENAIRVVTATDERGNAVLEVHDSGPGIPADLVDRIFDPFFTTKPTGVGTGLGLSICRSIVVALGGEITAQSRPGGGATFRVVLPPAAPLASEERPDPPQPAAPARGRRGRVLVVDDEPAVGSAIRRVLSPDHEVRVMTRAEEAREALERGERFDVILCDLMMPQMTGMELHAALERVAPDQARRMVVLTGGAFTEGGRAFLARVALPLVEKPFDAARLRELVGALVC